MKSSEVVQKMREAANEIRSLRSENEKLKKQLWLVEHLIIMNQPNVNPYKNYELRDDIAVELDRAVIALGKEDT